MILPGRDPCRNYVSSDLPLPRQRRHKQIYIPAHIRDMVNILFMHTYPAEQCYSQSIGTYCTDRIVPQVAVTQVSLQYDKRSEGQKMVSSTKPGLMQKTY